MKRILTLMMDVPNNLPRKVNLIVDTYDRNENLQTIKWYFENSDFLSSNLLNSFRSNSSKFLNEHISFKVV
jgi:hypothetical protein